MTEVPEGCVVKHVSRTRSLRPIGGIGAAGVGVPEGPRGQGSTTSPWPQHDGGNVDATVSWAGRETFTTTCYCGRGSRTTKKTQVAAPDLPSTVSSLLVTEDLIRLPEPFYQMLDVVPLKINK